MTKQTVIGQRLRRAGRQGVFIIGPTGLALGAMARCTCPTPSANRIAAIPDAATRNDSAGVGADGDQGRASQAAARDGVAPNGHLLVTNGLNGQVVEIDPAAGKQLYARWIDTNKAQSPPGSGDLFGLAMVPSGDGFIYVEDEVNALVVAH